MSQHDLYIFPRRNADGTLRYPMSTSRKKKPLPGDPEPKVELKRNAGKHGIYFTIVNDEDFGVTFSDDPIWINETGCPQETGIFTDQVTGYALRNSTQLELEDLNTGERRYLFYRLNFMVDGKPDSLDPEIKNGGSGPGGTKWLAFAALAAAAAVAYVAYQAFFDN